jgi:hypothetical protein
MGLDLRHRNEQTQTDHGEHQRQSTPEREPVVHPVQVFGTGHDVHERFINPLFSHPKPCVLALHL